MTIRNLLETIYEFQALVGKRDHLGLPLDENEQVRLLGLGRLLAGEGDGGHRTMPRVPVPMTVVFTLPGGFEVGQVRNVSGRGLAVATARPPEIDARTIVRAVDASRGCEYLFPCRVVWRRRAPLPGMGVAFDGVPTRSEWAPAEENTGIWRRSAFLAPAGGDIQAA